MVDFSQDTFKKYEALFESLIFVIRESELRIQEDEPDALFLDNINFFCKSLFGYNLHIS